MSHKKGSSVTSTGRITDLIARVVFYDYTNYLIAKGVWD
ncbi:hypothetical protein MC7420_3297 [Coleofasciculus chthonoplastes PCC 7420]|uniref:Uncharacterized protein n=1 Tax=Coleofasciculus chthonoplastes PCC 7420 TaxID=118168 RepID=B4VZ00_9CYAN|nr:hypothetical protein MC7420_3297 [Coleofasciculus chthonoplastes PCC 7420]